PGTGEVEDVGEPRVLSRPGGLLELLLHLAHDVLLDLGVVALHPLGLHRARLLAVLRGVADEVVVLYGLARKRVLRAAPMPLRSSRASLALGHLVSRLRLNRGKPSDSQPLGQRTALRWTAQAKGRRSACRASAACFVW